MQDREEHLDHLVQHPAAPASEFSKTAQAEAGQDRQQQDLQDIPVGEGADEGLGHDGQDVGHDAVGLGLGEEFGGRVGIERLGVDVETGAGLQHLGHHQAQDQGERRDHLEIDQRLGADTAEGLQVSHVGDAGGHGAEDDRSDQRPDQGDEQVAQGFQLHPDGRPQPAHQHAQRDGDQHLDIENPENPHAAPTPSRRAKLAILAGEGRGTRARLRGPAFPGAAQAAMQPRVAR